MNEPIKLDGKYKKRNGNSVTILCIDAANNGGRYPVLAQDNITKEFSTHYVDGRLYDVDCNLRGADLIPDVPLWEGEIWIHPDKDRDNIFLSEPTDTATWETSMSQLGYRKIKVREVE